MFAVFTVFAVSAEFTVLSCFAVFAVCRVCCACCSCRVCCVCRLLYWVYFVIMRLPCLLCLPRFQRSPVSRVSVDVCTMKARICCVIEWSPLCRPNPTQGRRCQPSLWDIQPYIWTIHQWVHFCYTGHHGPTYFDLKLQFFPRVTHGERLSHLSHV